MSIRALSPPSARACPFGLPIGFALFSTAAILLVIGVAAFATALSVIMLPHESKALGLELAIPQGFHPRQTLVPFIIHNRVSFGGLLVVNGLPYWRFARETS